MVAVLRQRFALAAEWSGWSAEERAEIGQAIAEVVDAGDEEAAGLWLAWLEQLAGLDWLRPRLRAFEASVREAALQARLAAQRGMP